MESADCKKPERRDHFRIVYSPKSRPILKVKDQRFEVVDISESGLKALNRAGRRLDSDWIRLTAVFLEGEHIDLIGKIVWAEGDEFGLRLKNFFPATVINKEKKRGA
ncbi:MAG: PilZ domain-containing protein [Desulfobacterales bacterium]|nr:PilZ domain-containing protein [Desulfobacterales bacterium]